MKTIFLDVDGVLNTWDVLEEHGLNGIGEYHLDHLKRIVDNTKARVVVSSSWRLDETALTILEEKLMTKGIKIFDCTVEIVKKLSIMLSGGVPRAEEIQEWLDRHPKVEKFAILDDREDAGENGLNHSFFQTSMEHGLTEEIANQVIEHLKIR